MRELKKPYSLELSLNRVPFLQVLQYFATTNLFDDTIH